jgi:hypothetical protein
MIRHVALFRWKPGFPPADLAEWTDRLRALPERVDGLCSLTVGPDRLHGERSWDAAAVAEVDSLADLPGYLGHPEHQAVARISAPHLAQLAMVDFEV